MPDSTDSFLPDYFQWSPSDSEARFWWDSTTAESREVLKQTRGRGVSRRASADSVVITLWLFSETSAEIRFAPFARPSGGIVQWLDEAHRSIARHTFVASVVPCPHLESRANDR